MKSRYIAFFLVFFIVFIGGITELSAQQKKLVQFSGVIRHVNSDNVVPYVTIVNHSYRNQTFSANHQGYFSFVVHEGDTISFTSLGYSSVKYIIPPVDGNKHTADVRMRTDVIELEVVEPFPWASVDEFNIAFMALELADDNITVARRNMSMESLAALAAVTPRDGNEMRGFNTDQTHVNLSNRAINQRMANPLLSPFAWGNLIRQISEGNRSRERNKW